nr:MAG TPA: hypothetical protein [Caudoviricetes sp.]
MSTARSTAPWASVWGTVAHKGVSVLGRAKLSQR